MTEQPTSKNSIKMISLTDAMKLSRDEIKKQCLQSANAVSDSKYNDNDLCLMANNCIAATVAYNALQIKQNNDALIHYQRKKIQFHKDWSDWAYRNGNNKFGKSCHNSSCGPCWDGFHTATGAFGLGGGDCQCLNFTCNKDQQCCDPDIYVNNKLKANNINKPAIQANTISIPQSITCQSCNNILELNKIDSSNIENYYQLNECVANFTNNSKDPSKIDSNTFFKPIPKIPKIDHTPLKPVINKYEKYIKLLPFTTAIPAIPSYSFICSCLITILLAYYVILSIKSNML